MTTDLHDSIGKPSFFAGIRSNLSGIISNSNQYFIIANAAIILLILVLARLVPYAPKIFIPVILVLIIAFLILLFVGLRRQCKISPMDELNQFSAKLVGVDRSYEIKAPNSLLTKELFSALVIPTYPENEPPVGVIEGDVTDKNAIKILTDDQRKALAEKEKEEIIQHQKDVVVKVEALTIKSELPQTAVSIPPEQDSKPTAHQ